MQRIELSVEGHESCIPIDLFKKLQELHDNQKKIIARLQQKVEEQEQEIIDLRADKAELSDNRST